MKNPICMALAATLLTFTAANGQTISSTPRPALTRLSHVAYYTKDIDNTLAFFKDWLGYDEMTRIDHPDGSLWIVVVKINDNQFLEIMPETSPDTKRLSHFAFETDDVEAMRRYMADRGLKVADRCGHDPILGTTNFFVDAPAGHSFEFVQTDDKGLIVSDRGRNLPATRVSNVMSHVALATPDLDAAKGFYEEVLGYKEIWRGGQDGKIMWVYDQLPDGADCIEFLLYDRAQSTRNITAMNHICLEVDDVAALREELLRRPRPDGIAEPSRVSVGSNNIRQMSLYNIDGIRVEVMENHTVDGMPPTFQTGEPLKFIPDHVTREGVSFKKADFPLYIDPVYNGSSDPTVCYNEQTGKWFMYYTSRRVNRIDLDNIQRIHGSPIGIAESTDGGATWRYTGDCNIDYKPDPEPTYWAPEVFAHEGVYHMYLSYVPGVFDNWNHPRDMVHLTSDNGIDWTTRSVIPLNRRKVIDAGVIRLPDGVWRMWYKNESMPNEIWYADSSDLYNWTDRGPADTGGPLSGEGANVIYWHDKYYMIVDEWKGLSVFSSDDATNWTKQEEYLIAGIPVPTGGTTTDTDESRGRRPQYLPGSRGNHADIQLAGDRAYMFYFSQTPPENAIRGLAVYVQELIHNPDGTISCDTSAPCYINLNAGR